MTKMNGRRGLAAALIISIAVNLFFLSVESPFGSI